MSWMPVMGSPRDDTTNQLLHAYCGFDFYMYGEQMANWVIDYYQKTWPDATLEKTGMLCLDFSTSYNLTVRIDAARDVWNKRYPGNEDKFFVADGASTGQLNSDTGFNISAPLIAAHPEVGGDYGPYFQTQRFEIYRKYIDRLLAEGTAYRCYCTQEELEAKRKHAEREKRQYRYDRT
jgi:ABC-type sugar transport system substrate-binding protein